MGGGSWTAETTRSYDSYAKSIEHTTHAHQVFKQTNIHQLLDPKDVELRESCDSETNPETNAIIIGLDVTGSMGMIAHNIAKEGLGNLMTGIMERKPVSDPQIQFMAIGDAYCDYAPLQVSQFEPDIRIVEQLGNIYVEGHGGGNATESYDLPWYFAAHKTHIDCFEKRGKKGYLFTMGDEEAPEVIRQRDLERILGSAQCDANSADTLALAQEKFDVFHLIIEEGSHCQSRHRRDRVMSSWNQLLGKRAILVDNYRNLSEIVLSIIEVNEGKDPTEVVASWPDADVRKSVHIALDI